MLWNSRFAFVHHPRMASKSLNLHFARHWMGPIYGSLSPAHLKAVNALEGVVSFAQKGRGTETMPQAVELLRRNGRTLSQLDAVIVPVRNPYDLMVSQYEFLRANFDRNSGRENFRIAAEEDFAGFCRKFKHTPFENWCTCSNGKRPDNLRLLRYENIEQDVDVLISDFNIEKKGDLIVTNESTRESYGRYMTNEAEALIFERYDFLFELGEYERESFE